jgi:hypothetical protein
MISDGMNFKIGVIRISAPQNAADIYKKNYKKMKLKAFLACIVLILSAAVSQANPGKKVARGYENVIKDFMDSEMKSNHKELRSVLSDEVNIKIPRGDTVLNENKTNTVEMMRESEGAVQNCECAYEVLGKSDGLVIARVDFKYGNCIQHNYITLEKNQDKEWQITQDCKIFDDINASNTSGGQVVAKN